MSAGKVLLGVVIGAAAGATLGVLFAPDKGSVTRKKLSREGRRGIESLKETAGEYVSAMEEKVGGFKETAGQLSDRTKGAVSSLQGGETRKHRT
jgi:gas vesicle protein